MKTSRFDRLLDDLKARWAALDFRPKTEDVGCPQCGSHLRAFRGQQCYAFTHEWHSRVK